MYLCSQVKIFVIDYLFVKYKRERTRTEKNIKIFEWKTSNKNKVELINDSEFVFEIDSKVLS